MSSVLLKRVAFLSLLILPALVGFMGLRSRAQATSQEPAKTIIVFWQEGFPTIESEPLRQADLSSALGSGVRFLDLSQLRSAMLDRTTLLILPYGSAVPTEAWPSIQHLLADGGNLLLLGGEPLRVPVSGDGSGAFVAEQPQDSYSRTLGLRHSYQVPLPAGHLDFHWRNGYSFFPKVGVRADQVFAQEGRLQGLGYFDDADGTHLAAPIIVEELGHSRVVALPFHPAPGIGKVQMECS